MHYPLSVSSFVGHDLYYASNHAQLVLDLRSIHPTPPILPLAVFCVGYSDSEEYLWVPSRGKAPPPSTSQSCSFSPVWFVS